MAQYYDVVSQTPSVQVTGQNDTLDVVELGFVTKPSGVYAQANAPASYYSRAGGDVKSIVAFVEPLAIGIEEAMALPGVIGARWEQDISTFTGLLTSYIVFTVGAPSPNPSNPATNAVDVAVEAGALTEQTLFSRLVEAPIAKARALVAAVAAA